jgi:hypothetical protein
MENKNERLRETQTLYDTSLTHPRPGYPLQGCVSTEPRSVSPNEQQDTPLAKSQQRKNIIEHPSHT